MPEGITRGDLKRAAKFGKKKFKELETSTSQYHHDSEHRWRKHADGKQVDSNLGKDEMFADVFVDETFQACDSLAIRLKKLAPASPEKIDCVYTKKGMDFGRKLKLIKSLVVNDLRLMGANVNFKAMVEDFTVEGTMWSKLEWDNSRRVKIKIKKTSVKEMTTTKVMLPGAKLAKVPTEKYTNKLESERYDEELDRGKWVPCKYERVFVDVCSGESLEETDLAHWVTTDFETLESLEYKMVKNEETGEKEAEGIYHNVKKLKAKIYEKLPESEKDQKVDVQLIDLWAYYDADQNESPKLCLITISKDHPSICLRVEKVIDFYPFDRKPFYKTVLFRRKGKQLGIGIPERIWNAQVQLNDAQTVLYENSMLRGYGVGFVSNNIGLTGRQLRLRPRKLIPVSDPTNAYRPVEFADVSATMLAVSTNLKNGIAATHGVAKSFRGAAQAGVDTAHEFESLLQESTEKIKDFMMNVEETTIEPFLNDYLMLVFENWDNYSKRAFPVLGEDAKGVQEFVRSEVFDEGFENLKFMCLGAMKMERDAVTNKRVFDTYSVFREDGTVPPSGKWKMKVDLLRSIHPDISEKEIDEYLGPMPAPPKTPFTSPVTEAENRGGTNTQSIQNQGAILPSSQGKAAIQGTNIASEGVGGV